MTREDLKKLLNAVSKTNFMVTYYDPIQDAIWVNISVSLIQVNNNSTEPDIIV